MKNGFSVIIPVYNEKEIIVKNAEKLMRFLDKMKKPYEIVLCDNGSSDSTREKGRELQKKFPKKVKFISIEEKGVGFAFRKAVLAASYNNLVSVDMDLTINLDFIPKCLNLLKDYSIVVGSKVVGSQKRSFYRKFISDSFITLTKLFLGLRFTDYSIGAKGYRKSDIIDRIHNVDHGSFYVIDFIYHVKQKGKKIIEIPTMCYDTRKSKFNLLNEITYRGVRLLSFCFRKKIINNIIPTPK
jgi:undecaprenyl-phosphate 4-deoxy-4-formamido-L-arabinose transferase